MTVSEGVRLVRGNGARDILHVRRPGVDTGKGWHDRRGPSGPALFYLYKWSLLITQFVELKLLVAQIEDIDDLLDR